MAAIRGKNTRPELLIRKALHARGFRYRLHGALPGKPDLVLPRWSAVILVHGCFWHGHDCPMFHWPATRAEFWHDKIGRNRARDAATGRALEGDGWRVATVWECALKGRGRLPLAGVIDSLAAWLSSDAQTICIKGEFFDRPADPPA